MLTPEEAAAKYDFIRPSEDGGYDIFADHHMLSSLRRCESYFDLAILQNVHPRGEGAWALDFGAWMHKCLEVYYKVKCAGKEYPLAKWLKYGAALWKRNGLSKYADFPQFKELGGYEGALAILIEYYNNYYGWKERLQIVGCELAFGYAKEVSIGQFVHATPDFYPQDTIDGHRAIYNKVNCYLSGRIDMVVDDGTFVGPLDHKTKKYFRGDETSSYSPHDGMLGYAYAVDKILGAKFAEQGRQCRQTIINHISLRQPKKGEDRFKRSFIQYSPSQFEEYRLRQLASFKRLFEITVLNEEKQWNTQSCIMFGKECPYRQLHSRAPEAREGILRAYYEVKDVKWNPYRND
jgi:hypothetical protein